MSSFDVDTGLRDLDTGDRSRFDASAGCWLRDARGRRRHDNSEYYCSVFNTFRGTQRKEHRGAPHAHVGEPAGCWAPLLRAIRPLGRRSPADDNARCNDGGAGGGCGRDASSRAGQRRRYAQLWRQ